MKLLSRIQRVIYGLFFAIVAYYSLGYFALHFSDASYVGSFSGNLLATLLGVAVGLPAALFLDRMINSRHEQHEVERRSAQEHAQLSLIKEELQQASKDITLRRDRGEIILPPINTQLWRTLQPSKRVREVKDLHVIVKIGDAYNRISAHQELEMQFHGLRRSSGTHDPQAHVLTDLRNMDEATLASIAEAVKAIKHYIKHDTQ